MQPPIAQHDHLPVVWADEGVKGRSMAMGRGTLPRDHQPKLIQEQAELSPHNPANVRLVLLADLLGAPSFSNGMAQLNPPEVSRTPKTVDSAKKRSVHSWWVVNKRNRWVRSGRWGQ